MHDLFGSLRKSLYFRADSGGGRGISEIKGKIEEKIGSAAEEEEEAAAAPAIRWRKGELIGCGAFGQVYIGMNLDSGSLLAVKQVLIPTKEAQEQVEELEKEVKLLKNLSHPNIVRYLGITREEEAINILLEFVPGGSISSLLGKFGSFPEAVIRTYTQQLLQGLEYLHQNKILHRDIKGANILVDNKGCIKLADFGASKKVQVLTTMAATKSMKGTPCYMAPEVIRSEEPTFSADIWSVGCTVIEMATGKPPWSQQFQGQVAVMFCIGTTKAHPPIPEHLSSEAKDFLFKCFQKEPSARPSASNLLRHPFVTGEFQDQHLLHRPIAMDPSKSILRSNSYATNMNDPDTRPVASCEGLNGVGIRDSSSAMFSGDVLKVKPLWEMDSCDDMCQFYDKDDFPVLESSYNPMVEPLIELQCKFEPSADQEKMDTKGLVESVNQEKDFTFPSEAIVEDDDEVTESKIRAFLDEKAVDLKKLQTPLYEFLNSLNTSNSPFMEEKCEELAGSNLKLPSKSKLSPTRGATGILDQNADAMGVGNCSAHCNMNIDKNLREIPSPKINEWEGLHDAQGGKSLRMNVSKKHKKWREELDQELAREREMRLGGRVSPGYGATSHFSQRFNTRAN